MRVFKEHLTCVLLAVAVATTCLTVAAYCKSRDDLSIAVLTRIQNEPFYRSPEQLAADGVEVTNLAIDQEESLHRGIRTYYATEYREEFKGHVEALLIGGINQGLKERYSKELEASGTAAIPVSAYSSPRKYDGLSGVVGMFAAASLYDIDLGNFGGTGNLFFFRVDGEKYRLEKVFSVGEDARIYESAPVERYKREVSNQSIPPHLPLP